MARRVIALLGMPVITEEGAAAEAITPGHLVAGVTSLTKQTGDPAPRRIALERDEMGKDIDTPYAVGDTVKVGSFAPGQHALLWLASGENVTAGGFLEPGTNGMVVAYSSGGRFAVALESVNASAGDARIRAEIY